MVTFTAIYVLIRSFLLTKVSILKKHANFPRKVYVDPAGVQATLVYHLRNTVQNLTTEEIVKNAKQIKGTFTNEATDDEDIIINVRTRQSTTIRRCDNILNVAVCTKNLFKYVVMNK